MREPKKGTTMNITNRKLILCKSKPTEVVIKTKSLSKSCFVVVFVASLHFPAESSEIPLQLWPGGNESF